MTWIGSDREFLEKYGPMVRASARTALWVKGCSDPETHSEDVAIDVAIRVFEHWDGFRSPVKVLPAIIRNEVSRHMGDCLTEVAQEIDDGATPCFQVGQDPEETLLEGLLLEEWISQLSPTQRNVIQLWVYGFSFDEISKRLGILPDTLRSIKSRALKKLREGLA